MDRSSYGLIVYGTSFGATKGTSEEIAKIRKIALEDKVSKYGLEPITTGLFGGVLNYNKMGFLARKGMKVAFKSRLQKRI